MATQISTRSAGCYGTAGPTVFVICPSMNKNLSGLQSLPIGGTGVIAAVRGPQNAVRRINELGLTKGTAVTIVRKAPFGGPIEVSIDGTHLAVRLAEDLSIDVLANGR